jgi:hypothetical protein
MDIFPSFYCNNNCNFCFHKYRGNDISDQNTLNISLLENILSSIHDRNYKAYILGGELTLLDEDYQKELISSILKYTSDITYITTLQKIPSDYILNHTTLAISIDYALRPYSMDTIYENITEYIDGTYNYEIFTMFSSQLIKNIESYEKFFQLKTGSIIFDMQLSDHMEYDPNDLIALIEFIKSNRYTDKVINKIFHKNFNKMDITFNFLDDIDIYPDGRILLRPSFLDHYKFNGIPGNSINELYRVYNNQILIEYYSCAECISCEYIGACIYRFNMKMENNRCIYKNLNEKIMNMIERI